jgi:hypothetical protein
MDYENIYAQLISKYSSVKQAGYEGHHVVPKSMGGTDDPSNIVFVPCRVHFILHRCLFKIYKNKQMGYAMMRMSAYSRYNSKQYSLSKLVLAGVHPLKQQANKDKISECMKKNNPMKSAEARASMAAKQMGNKYRAVYTYTITFPDGRVEVITDMKQYCEANNLHRGRMAGLATGREKFYRGMTVTKQLTGSI